MIQNWVHDRQRAGALFTSTFEYFWRQGTIEYTLFLVFLWHVGLPIIFNKLKFQAIIFNTATTTCTSWTSLVRSESLVNTLPVQPRFPHYSRLSSAARSDLIWSMICQRGELKGKHFNIWLIFTIRGKCWASKCTLLALRALFPLLAPSITSARNQISKTLIWDLSSVLINMKYFNSYDWSFYFCCSSFWLLDNMQLFRQYKQRYIDELIILINAYPFLTNASKIHSQSLPIIFPQSVFRAKQTQSTCHWVSPQTWQSFVLWLPIFCRNTALSSI